MPALTAPVTAVPDRRRLGLRLLALAAVLAALGVALASLPGLDELRARLAGAAPGWLGIALALEVASCLAFVAVFRGVFARDLAWRPSYELGMAVQGTNVLLPAGGASGLALGAYALARTGTPAGRLARRAVAFFLLTSAVNFATAVLAGGALALGLASGGVAPWLTAGTAGLAALCIAVVALLPRALGPPREPAGAGAGRAARAGRAAMAGRAALVGGVAEAGALLRTGDHLIVGGAVGYMAFDLAALAAAFQALGALPPLGVLALAYVLGQLGGLLPLPGGVGGADGGLVAALALLGTPLAGAAAAVLAYRAFQLGVPALLGSVAVLRLPIVVERLREDRGPRAIPGLVHPG